jgi:DNA-directed RNA polymerase subunit E"
MASEVACKQCKALTTGRVCPVCKATELSPDWSGIIVIFDALKSQVAATLDISVPHKYALKVS